MRRKPVTGIGTPLTFTVRLESSGLASGGLAAYVRQGRLIGANLLAGELAVKDVAEAQRIAEAKLKAMFRCEVRVTWELLAKVAP